MISERIKLSERLRMNVSLVPNGARVADIGCDHGYASIWLVEHGTAQTVIAMDVNEGPIRRARKHIRQMGLDSRIECRKSDGLEKLCPGEVDTLLIAGMGGPLMIRILREGAAVMQDVHTLILQPQSELAEVRKFLIGQGFVPVEEKACFDDGKYYFAICARRRETGDGERWEEEWQYRYGTYLVKKRDPVLKRYLCKEKGKYEEILNNFAPGQAQAEPGAELRHKINEIDKCLAQMSAGEKG